MKVVFIGCVEFSAVTLRHLIASRDCEIAGVITRRQSAFNADFHSLEDISSRAKIPCFLAEGNNQEEMADWISRLAPEVVYCFGWSFLLKERILKMTPLGVIGFHPAALPRNRGRHPIIWALVLGLPEMASTFFFMDEGADSGDILSQKFLPILDSDDASTLYLRLTELALLQITDFTKRLGSGSAVRIPQDHSLANTWRKRGKLDGQVDWRMTARNIHNLVRALTRPYVGAHCVWEAKDIKIWRTRPVSALGSENIEPGKVLARDESAIIIKCGEAAIELLEHEFETIPSVGSYL